MKWTPSGTRVWTCLLGTAEDDNGAGVAIAANGDPLLVASTAGALAGTFAGGFDIGLFSRDAGREGPGVHAVGYARGGQARARFRWARRVRFICLATPTAR